MPAELKAVLGVSGLFNLLFAFYPGPLVAAAKMAASSLRPEWMEAAATAAVKSLF
jgi:hypothetical protein